MSHVSDINQGQSGRDMQRPFPTEQINKEASRRASPASSQSATGKAAWGLGEESLWAGVVAGMKLVLKRKRVVLPVLTALAIPPSVEAAVRGSADKTPQPPGDSTVGSTGAARHKTAK